jgi:hypothetical protein
LNARGINTVSVAGGVPIALAPGWSVPSLRQPDVALAFLPAVPWLAQELAVGGVRQAGVVIHFSSADRWWPAGLGNRRSGRSAGALRFALALRAGIGLRPGARGRTSSSLSPLFDWLLLSFVDSSSCLTPSVIVIVRSSAALPRWSSCASVQCGSIG